MLIKQIVLFAAIILIGGVLGANVYNSVVDVPNWGTSIPSSLDVAKQYFTAANPGTFFRAVSPAMQIAALFALIVTWRTGGKSRIFAALAFVLSVSGDVLTFSYFYPRNAIMFGTEQHTAEVLSNTWSTWASMNHVRNLIVLAALICELSALTSLIRADAGNGR